MSDLDQQLEEELDLVIVSGVVSARLVELVHARALARVTPELAPDIAQAALCKLVEHLPRLRADMCPVAWLGMTLVNSWRYAIRQRKCEQRYLGWAVERLLDDVPGHARGAARGKARNSMRRVLKLKFY